MNATDAARTALACLDLTSLKADDSDERIEALARRAATPHGAPAALCVYPAFVPAARRTLDELALTGVRIATVVDFPHGRRTPDEVAEETRAALAQGADEIDVVVPWQALAAGRESAVLDAVKACRNACDGYAARHGLRLRARAGQSLHDAAGAHPGHPVPVKAILETGELKDAGLIRAAAELAVAGGADFLKTSTGTVAVNATPEAVAVLLQVIRAGQGRVGLKIAGGVSTVAQVQAYLAQVSEACGADWITPDRLRFGASGLLAALLAELGGTTAPPAAAGY